MEIGIIIFDGEVVVRVMVVEEEVVGVTEELVGIRLTNFD